MKKRLTILIERFLNEDDDFSVDKDLEAESEKVQAAVEFAYKGAKSFLNLRNHIFESDFDKTKRQVIEYYNSNKFDEVLNYIELLKKNPS